MRLLWEKRSPDGSDILAYYAMGPHRVFVHAEIPEIESREAHGLFKLFIQGEWRSVDHEWFPRNTDVEEVRSIMVGRAVMFLDGFPEDQR